MKAFSFMGLETWLSFLQSMLILPIVKSTPEAKCNLMELIVAATLMSVSRPFNSSVFCHYLQLPFTHFVFL